MFPRVLLVAVCFVGMSVGELRSAEIDLEALQSAIEKTAESYSSGFKNRDAASLAALFTLEAEYVDASGVVFHGRDVIEAELGARFEMGEPGGLEIEIISLRPIAEGLVAEEGVTTFQPADGSAGSRSRYAAIHVRQPDGAWLMASVRELNLPAMSAHDHLMSLAWLEGEWVEEAGGSVASTKWGWGEEGNFLISEFDVTNPDGSGLQGTQRVGWDVERQQFRSWIFDSTGGSAEGYWSRGEDGTWSVQVTGVDADGARISGTLTYSHDGGDGLVIVQDHRSRGGIGLPSVTHRVVRQPPRPDEQVSR